ncbi:hypothetical protein [Halomonas sp. NO4]|uniref:hypothetical protein n=1 Tax=Halomonas sp. NO4 TaxID=2484813 RepID=UPI0013D74FA5|nr:hypothetical protein [Halomonas sp. NO4]
MPFFEDYEIEWLADDLDEHARTLQALGQRLEPADADATHRKASRTSSGRCERRCSMAGVRGASRHPQDEPISVMVHHTPTGARYVRIRDIPEALQDDFMGYLRGAPMPVVDDEPGPVAFETDWHDWVHHRRPDRATRHATTVRQGGESHDNTFPDYSC